MHRYPTKRNSDGTYYVMFIGGPFDGDQRRLDVPKCGNIICLYEPPEYVKSFSLHELPTTPVLCDEVRYRILRIASDVYIALYEELNI